MDTLQTPGSSLLFQIGVLALILFFFFAGMILRSCIDKTHLSPLQLVAGGVIVFMTFGMPIGQLICNTLTPNATLFAFATASLPTFTFGVTMKEQLARIIPAADPKAQDAITGEVAA